jgi:hypothetical protein
MVIHLRVKIDNARGRRCAVAAVFRENDRPVLSQDPDCRTSNGSLVLVTVVTPDSTSAAWQDLQLFLPIQAPQLGRGQHQINFVVAVLCDRELLNKGDLTEGKFTINKR